MNSNKIGFAQLVPKTHLNGEGFDQGLMSYVIKRLSEKEGIAIADMISDGSEYIVKALPETLTEKPEFLAVEVRKEIAVKRLVRCGECIHRKHPADYCDMLRKAYMPDEFFCFYGKSENRELDEQVAEWKAEPNTSTEYDWETDGIEQIVKGTYRDNGRSE